MTNGSDGNNNKTSSFIRLFAPGLLFALVFTLAIGWGIHVIHARTMETLNSQFQALTAQYEELSTSLARAESNQVNAGELKDRISQLIIDNKTLQKDLAKLNARPTSITYVTGNTGGSNSEIINAPDDLNNDERLSLEWLPNDLQYRTPSGVLVAQHSINREEGSFVGTTHNLIFSSATVISKSSTDQQTAHTQITLTSEAEPENTVTLDLTHAELTYETPQTKQFFVAPHLNVGVGIGADIINKQPILSASVGVSIFAYGRTTSDNTLRFLNIRGDVGSVIRTSNADNRILLGIGIDPILINIAKPLPLLDDLYLGAGINAILALPLPDSTSSSPTPQGGVGITITLSSTI